MAQKDVFVILAELKRRILGISDQNPKGIEGFITSFLPVGEPIFPGDFKHPWKPNMTSPTNVQPPAGAPPVDPSAPADTADIAKRYEALANTCTLVDRKIRLNELYQAIPNTSTISQTWEVIINAASVMPMDPAQEALQKTIRDKYLPRLRKTIKDDDGGDIEVDTKEYKAYKDYQKAYHKAQRDYTTQYMVNMSNRAMAQMWGIVGKSYIADVEQAWSDWNNLGNKQFIEDAIDNLSAIGTDASAHMIAAAKMKFDAYKVATQGVIPVTSQYVELFPSNWCETNVDNDGWTEYTYDSKNKTVTTDDEQSGFSASGGFSMGLWSVGANVSHEHAEQHNDMVEDNLTISLKYAVIDINRPWLDTLLFDLSNWYLAGDFPKGCISNGRTDQVFPSTNSSTWLPLIPQQIVVIKDLVINSSHIHEHYDAVSSSTTAGGSIGYGPFTLKGQYHHSKNTTSLVAQKTDEGLRVDGPQIMGWISAIVHQVVPAMASPKASPAAGASPAATPVGA